jgi:hypothetical protein
MKTIKRDVRVTNHGSIFSVELQTRRAKKWWQDHVNDGLEFGNAKIVEHRYISDIVNGMLEDGINVGGVS